MAASRHRACALLYISLKTSQFQAFVKRIRFVSRSIVFFDNYPPERPHFGSEPAPRMRAVIYIFENKPISNLLLLLMVMRRSTRRRREEKGEEEGEEEEEWGEGEGEEMQDDEEKPGGGGGGGGKEGEKEREEGEGRGRTRSLITG